MKRVAKKLGVRKIVVLSIMILIMLFVIGIFNVNQHNKIQLNIKAYEKSQELENQPLSATISSEVYLIENGYISKILPETTVNDLKNNFDNTSIQVFDKDNNQIQNNQLVGTGMKLKIGDSEYKLVVLGDTTGDGKIGISDLVQSRLNQIGKRKLSGEYKKAADIDFNGDITITDIVKIRLALINILDVKAPNTFVPEVKSTKDTITVKGDTIDANSGIKEYWFEINKNGWVKNTNALNNEYTFTNLTKETKYRVRMKVVDNLGNIKITKRVEVETLNEENANITITASTDELTNQGITVSVTYNSNIAKETKQIKIGNGNWEDYTKPVTINKNTKIYARVVNSEGTVLEEQTKQISNIDKLAPKEFSMTATATTNSITVNAQTTDAEATNEYGQSGIKEYEYVISKGDWSVRQTTTENTYTFEELEQGQEYKVTVIAKDLAGNETKAKNADGTEEDETIKTPTLEEEIEKLGEEGKITIVPSTEEWTNQDIEVTVTYPEIEGLIKEVSIDNGITWDTYTDTLTISKNTTIQARLRNVSNQTGGETTKEITNIDKLAPKDFKINAVANTNSIAINISTEDTEATEQYGKSGIAGYQFKINDENWTTVKETGNYTFENLTQGTNYTIKVRAIDNAGNITNANQNGSTDGVIIPTPIIDDIIKEIGSIQIKQNIEDATNTDVVIEVIYPEVSGLIKQVKIGNEAWKTYTGTFKVSTNTKIEARLTDKAGQSGTVVEKYITNIDKLAPNEFEVSTTVTTNSITISVGTTANPGTTDAVSTAEYACSGIKKYKYTIINGLWKWTETTSDVSHTFTNLMQGKTYKVIVTAIDNAENETANDDITPTQTNTAKEIEITADKTAWTKDNVKVTVTYPSDTDELTREISIDNGATWQDYTNISTEVTITENTTVKARLMDGENQIGTTAEYRVVNIDKTQPEDFTISETVTSTTIEIGGSTTDAGSGLKRYYFSKDNGATWVSNSNLLSSSYKFTGLQPATTYNMQIKVTDSVGNERIVTKQVTTDSEYTLTINADGGTYSGSTSISKAEGEKVTIQNPRRTGYTFNGWSLTGAGTLSGTTYTFGVGNATLTAQWEIIKYTVTFDANGGTLSPSANSVTVKAGSSITLPTVTRNGFEFIGWYSDKYSTTPIGNAGEQYLPNYNITLYAKWSAYIYNRGDECKNISGGWYKEGSDITMESDHICLTPGISGPVLRLQPLCPLASYEFETVTLEYEYSGSSGSVNEINSGKLDGIGGTLGGFYEYRLNGTGTMTIELIIDRECPYYCLLYLGSKYGNDVLKIYSIKLSQ